MANYRHNIDEATAAALRSATFNESGTNVETIIVVAIKPYHEQA